MEDSSAFQLILVGFGYQLLVGIERSQANSGRKRRDADYRPADQGIILPASSSRGQVALNSCVQTAEA